MEIVAWWGLECPDLTETKVLQSAVQFHFQLRCGTPGRMMPFLGTNFSMVLTLCC